MRQTAEDTRYRARARSVIRGGDQRVSRQMALRMRRKSTCRRTTSNGSVTVITTGSHVTDPAVQEASSMWTVRMLAADAIPLATGPPGRLFPGRPAVGARWKSALTDPAKPRLGP